RALAERREAARVRARHGAHGFGPCQEQVPLALLVRGAAPGAPDTPGPRRRGVLPEHKGARPMKRRKFLKTASAAGLSLVASPRGSSWLRSPGEKGRGAVMGLNGRGTVLARRLARAVHAEVGYVCERDSLVPAEGVS